MTASLDRRLRALEAKKTPHSGETSNAWHEAFNVCYKGYIFDDSKRKELCYRIKSGSLTPDDRLALDAIPADALAVMGFSTADEFAVFVQGVAEMF